MAYVKFYKGLSSDYVPETHQDGIYQCTDTGDTYLFGVLNSGNSQSVDLSNYLAKDNQDEFTPTGDYNPSTKKYVDDTVNSNLSNYATTDSVQQAISDATFNNGHNAVSSVAGIPVSKRLVIATINGNGSFTLASTPADGREIHVIVHNTNSSDIEITMPSGSNYVKMSGDTLTVAGGSYADINVVSDGTNMYVRAL